MYECFRLHVVRMKFSIMAWMKYLNVFFHLFFWRKSIETMMKKWKRCVVMPSPHCWHNCQTEWKGSELCRRRTREKKKKLLDFLIAHPRLELLSRRFCCCFCCCCRYRCRRSLLSFFCVIIIISSPISSTMANGWEKQDFKREHLVYL